MDKLRKKVIAAITKQVELLGKDGVSRAQVDSAIETIRALTPLLDLLDNFLS